LATGKKIILIILDLLLLTFVLPTAWDYYNFMEYDWVVTTSSNLPFVGEYMPDYLFWGSITLAVLLIIVLIVIVCYPRTYIDVALISNNGNLTLKRSAIEGFVNEKVKENDYLKNSKIYVSLYKNKIDIDIKGEIIPRVEVAQKAKVLEQEIIEGLKNFFGLEQAVKLNVEVTSLSKEDSSKRLRVI
jgi:hypothetical protein